MSDPDHTDRTEADPIDRLGAADVGTLVARLGVDATSRAAVVERFDSWWPARDERAAELLDALAAMASGGRTRPSSTALDVVLELVDRHGIGRPPIRRYLIDEHDIADAEQATLAVVGLRIDTWNRQARFTTWLHRVAENEAKQLIRSRDRRPSTPHAQLEPAAFVTRLSTVLADRDLVERAIAALPDELRRPLVLREFDHLDYAEIAGALDLEIGTVRSRLHRARHALVHDLRARLA